MAERWRRGDEAAPAPAESEGAHLETLEEARSWVGHKLDALDGRTPGRVEGVLVDERDGEPAWVVVRTGRLRRRSAVPYELAVGGIGHVWVPYPRETIRAAPELDPEAGIVPETERALCEHFGLPGDDRRRRIGVREDDAVTAVPAPAHSPD